MDYEAMGRRVKSLREAKRLSQRELAGLAEISVSALQGIERGNENVRLEAVVRLAGALNVSLDALVNPLTASDSEMIGQSVLEARMMLQEAEEQLHGALERLEACAQPTKIRWAKIMIGE